MSPLQVILIKTMADLHKRCQSKYKVSCKVKTLYRLPKTVALPLNVIYISGMQETYQSRLSFCRVPV